MDFAAVATWVPQDHGIISFTVLQSSNIIIVLTT